MRASRFCLNARTARHWLQQLVPENVPRHHFDLSFARSSGPGGQNVNKVNSKATIKMDADEWTQVNWIPSEVKDQLVYGKFPYITKKGAVIVTSQKSRDWQVNLDDCFDKFCRAIKSSTYIPPERKEEDIKRWEEIRKKTNNERLDAKKRVANKKQSRKAAFE